MCARTSYRTIVFSTWDIKQDSLPIPNSLLAVISGDSLVLRGRPGPQGQPPKERYVSILWNFRKSSIFNSCMLHYLSRILHLADVTAPRLGTQTREDEVRHPNFINSVFCLPPGSSYIPEWSFCRIILLYPSRNIMDHHGSFLKAP